MRARGQRTQTNATHSKQPHCEQQTQTDNTSQRATGSGSKAQNNTTHNHTNQAREWRAKSSTARACTRSRCPTLKVWFLCNETSSSENHHETQSTSRGYRSSKVKLRCAMHHAAADVFCHEYFSTRRYLDARIVGRAYFWSRIFLGANIFGREDLLARIDANMFRRGDTYFDACFAKQGSTHNLRACEGPGRAKTRHPLKTSTLRTANTNR